MDDHAHDRPQPGRLRRWLIGFDPIFEGGRTGKRAQDWAVEDELVAIALLGDVTIDLSRVRSAPRIVSVEAWALIRDVDIRVGEGDRVELSGGAYRGELRNAAPEVAGAAQGRLIRVVGHAFLGDVTIRRATEDQ